MPDLEEIQAMKDKYIWKKNPTCECGHGYREHKEHHCLKCNCRYFRDKSHLKKLIKYTRDIEKAHKKTGKSKLRFGDTIDGDIIY